MKTKIIIDCDPGCDDTIALVAALSSPLFDVVGITSIGGNVDPAKTQANAMGICTMMNRPDVPVVAGCDRPLIKAPVIADDIHGESGVDGLTLPSAPATQLDIDAADFILAETAKAPGEITLVVIGPMTNIAIALQRDPSLPARVKRIFTMGGAFGNPGGNMTPYAEFNIFCDPHAAKIVYGAFDDIMVFPLDVTHRIMQDDAFRAWLSTQGALGENLTNMLTCYAASYPRMNGDASPLHDFHTIAAMIDPSLYSFSQGQVQITVDGVEEGRTTLVQSQNVRHKVALDVDLVRFVSVLKDALKAACDQA